MVKVLQKVTSLVRRVVLEELVLAGLKRRDILKFTFSNPGHIALRCTLCLNREHSASSMTSCAQTLFACSDKRSLVTKVCSSVPLLDVCHLTLKHSLVTTLRCDVCITHAYDHALCSSLFRQTVFRIGFIFINQKVVVKHSNLTFRRRLTDSFI